MRPSSQARAAKARVLKNLAAQSHLSIRTEVMIYSPTDSVFTSTLHPSRAHGKTFNTEEMSERRRIRFDRRRDQTFKSSVLMFFLKGLPPLLSSFSRENLQPGGN